jgi:hypothetical protein
MEYNLYFGSEHDGYEDRYLDMLMEDRISGNFDDWGGVPADEYFETYDPDAFEDEDEEADDEENDRW